MKKLISCLLAVLLVCSLMSMSVFAETYRPVGNNGQDINAGVGDFTSPTTPTQGNGEHDITVNFGQTTDDSGTSDTTTPGASTIIHRYAVDVTYGSFLLDLTNLNFGDNGNGLLDEGENRTYYMVWNVNSHKYELCTEDNGVYTPVTDTIVDPTPDNTENNDETDLLETPVTLPGEVYITNHSDLSVNTLITVASVDNYNDIEWVINTTKENGEAAVRQEELIAKATAGVNGADGTATDGATYTFTATPATDNGWIGVIGNFSKNNIQNAATIGKITVTISK